MSLTNDLYRCIDENDRPREIKHWHCSSIAKCPRALYFERLKVPELVENQPGAGKKLRWRAGHAIEATIRPELEKVFPKMLSNIRFTNDELDLTGEFDGYDLKSKSLISVKSTHDFAMITLNGKTGLKDKIGMKISTRSGKPVIDWGLKTEPYIHHQWQEHAYVALFEDRHTNVDELGDFLDGGGVKEFVQKLSGVENIIYVYITLGGLIDTYQTAVNPEILARVKAKVAYLNKCWAEKTLPICTCREGQEMFNETNQYCGYKTKTGCCSAELLHALEVLNEREK
jgi:hypothetical protein